MLPQPLNSSAISNGKLVDTWAKLKVYDLIDVILLEGQSGIYNLEKLGLLGTDDTWRRQASTKAQHNTEN